MSVLASILCTAVVLFPIWQPIWEQEPLNSQNMEVQANSEITTAVLEKLREGYRITAPEARGSMIVDLAAAPIPANLALLLEWLGQESEPLLLSTLLRQISRMGLTQVPPDKIAPFLQHPQIAVAESAIELYGKLPAANYQLLEPFLRKTEETPVPLTLRLAAWKAYRDHPDKAAYLGRKVLDFRQDESLAVQGLALAVATAQSKRLPDVLAWLDTAVNGPAGLRLVVARDPHPDSQARLRKLLADPEPGIRQAVCVANAGTHLPAILTALQDSEPFVRLAALQALPRFRHSGDQASTAAIRLFADPDPSVRTAAGETLVALAAQEACGVPPLLLAQLSQPESTCRLQAMLSLSRLQLRAAAEPIAALLPQETQSENLAAALTALGVLAEPQQFGELILPLAEHQSPLVRAAAAFAIGKLHSRGGEPVLKELCLDKHSATVREAAFLAMGHFPQGLFATDLLTCLKKTSSTTSDERRNAAWAIGRLVPATPAEYQQLQALAQRLILQCTTPVIPGMEPMFENMDVIGNAIFSLVSLCKRFPEDAALAEALARVMRIYEIPWQDFMDNPSKYPSLGQMAPPIDAVSNSLAFQARQWLEDKPFSSIPVPPRSLSFNYNQTRTELQ
ncbi:MAG: HEAT repeat domain-containing protein [Lentisphaerae bacterium]|nr:HEAT repeat domain-containing protein [Lentisphaerota bacterium]